MASRRMHGLLVHKNKILVLQVSCIGKRLVNALIVVVSDFFLSRSNCLGDTQSPGSIKAWINC